MEKEPRFRILNKTRETVTIKLLDKPMTFSWKEFNKKLIVVDKVWAVPNEEEKKKQEKAEELINDAVVSMLILRGNIDTGIKFAHMAALGNSIDEASKLLECNKLEVMQIIRKKLMMLNPFMVSPMFSENEMSRSGIHPKRVRKNPRRDKYGNPEVLSTVENKPTLGDAFACLGELKDKMEKE